MMYQDWPKRLDVIMPQIYRNCRDSSFVSQRLKASTAEILVRPRRRLCSLDPAFPGQHRADGRDDPIWRLIIGVRPKQ